MDDNTRRALASLTTAVASLVDAVQALANPNPAQPDADALAPLVAVATDALQTARAAQD